MLSDEEMNELAIKVAARLNSAQVTRLIPKNIQEALIKWSGGYPFKYQFVMPVGPGGIRIEIEIQPDGSFKINLADITGYPFWNAHLEALNE